MFKTIVKVKTNSVRNVVMIEEQLHIVSLQLCSLLFLFL